MLTKSGIYFGFFASIKRGCPNSDIASRLLRNVKYFSAF